MLRVLLIEDNDGDADLVQEAFAELPERDVEIGRVERLQSAADRLTTEQYDVVLLDLSLPDASGLDGLLRLQAVAPGVPIVVLTGLVDATAGTRALQSGAQDYLHKSSVGRLELTRAVRYARERHAFVQRAHLLADVSLILAGVTRMDEIAPAVTALLSQQFADWSAIEGAGERVEGTPAPAIADATAGLARLHRTLDDVPLASADQARASVLRAHGFASAILVALNVSGLAPGLLVLARRASSPAFSDTDVVLVEEIARRVAGVFGHHLVSTLLSERQAAAASNRLKDEFLATLSHELRTPITAIMGWAQMLHAGILDAARTKHALEVIERNARSQVALIEDVLDVSRIVTGKLHLNIADLDLVVVLGNAIETVTPAARAKDVRIELSTDAPPATARGDADRLQQVLWNLLANAVKFTPRGGAVSVRLSAASSSHRVTITDTGQGISAAFLPYVFDRFRQADASATRTHSGLGLGMAITRHLVELHGGTIAVASDGDGRGATFTLDLPIESERREPVAAVQ